MKIFILLSILLVAVNAASLKSKRPNPRYGLNERIVGGEVVDIKDYPHQVSLQFLGHFCGGSVISKDYVLTAAHCVEGKIHTLLAVRAGSTLSDNGGQFVQFESVLEHPQYDFNTLDYDFALVKLNKSLEFNENVQPIRLTEQNVNLSAGTMVTVTGWGSTQNITVPKDKLRAVSVTVVDQEECNEKYADFYGITPQMLCAGLEEGGKDSCQGDSGGPLTSNNVLVGVVSWGKGCALKGYPGVYSRIAAVRDWIRENSGV